MTQGWVVYGGMRHAEPQMFPRKWTLYTTTTFCVVSIVISTIINYVIKYYDMNVLELFFYEYTPDWYKLYY